MRCFWVLGLCVGLVGCNRSGGGGEGSGDPVTCPSVLTPPAVYQAVTETPVLSFSFRLFNKVWEQNRGSQPEGGEGWRDHGFLSPLSVWYVLLMLERGTVGVPKSELLEAMGIAQERVTEVEEVFRMYREALLPSCGVDLRLLNGFWYKANDPFLSLVPEYLVFARGYGAEPVPIVFTDTQEVEEKINRWVTENTDGFLSAPFPGGNINGADSLIVMLANLLYFQGQWLVRMVREGSRIFYGVDRQDTVQVWLKGLGRGWMRSGEYRAVWLPFRGEEYGMMLVQPFGSRSLEDWVRDLPQRWGEVWESLIRGGQEVRVWIPAWDRSVRIDLEAPLKLLGVTTIFDKDGYFFTDMFSHPKPQKVRFVRQIGRIQVTEEGVRAAAVTIVGIESTMWEPEEYWTFDHPFFYAIVHRPTGLPLFMGVYLNPIPAELEKGS